MIIYFETSSAKNSEEVTSEKYVVAEKRNFLSSLSERAKICGLFSFLSEGGEFNPESGNDPNTLNSFLNFMAR